MRGKSTFANGMHHSQAGSIIPPIDVSVGDWRELEKVLGPLTEAERTSIAETCGQLLEFLKEEAPSASDVRVTLEKISALKDDNAVFAAYSNCDTQTECLILSARYQMDGASLVKVPLTAAKIRMAASLALAGFRAPSGPRRLTWQTYVAEYATRLADSKGLSTTAHNFDIEPEQLLNEMPRVFLLQTLLAIIDPLDREKSTSHAVKLLGEVNARAA